MATAFPADASTLHLPRILCLHGGGTNARIFQMQCRAIERSLSSTFRLVYANAPFSSQAGPDVLSVFSEDGPFRAWLRWRPEDPERETRETVDMIKESLSNAIHEDDTKGATGAWVALLGFSQGAKIAASMLFSQQYRGERYERNAKLPHFRFAVLVAGRAPLVWLAPELAMPEGLIDAASLPAATHGPVIVSPEHMLRVPTIHVHGSQDPGMQLHRNLLNWYCDPDSATVIEWDGGHRLPIRSKDVDQVVEQIYSMARKTGAMS